MSFFLLLNIHAILKKVENQTVAGQQWLAYYYFSFYQSQCGPATVWIPTFFKISYFVFSTRKKWIQVWNNMSQGSRVRPIWSHVRPNFSGVRLKKNFGRTGASSHSRKKKLKFPRLRKSLCCSTTDTLGSYRGLNQSEIVKDGPPLWLAVVQIFLYVCVRLKMRVLLQSEREVS